MKLQSLAGPRLFYLSNEGEQLLQALNECSNHFLKQSVIHGVPLSS
jgi:hypothetical protein